MGEETHEVSDLPVFRTGARYLLLLNESDTAGFSPVRYWPAGAIEVENPGDLELTLDCQVTGADTPSFKLLECPTPIAVGQSADIAVSCKPLAA